MIALGFCGLISGIVFSKITPKRISLSLYGFFAAFVIYGIIVDLSSVFAMLNDITSVSYTHLDVYKRQL